MTEEKNDQNVVPVENYEVTSKTIKGIAALARKAERYANSLFVPEVFRGKPDDIFAALCAAERLGIDEFGLMQSAYVVYGKIAFSTQFKIGAFNSCGKYESLQYEFFGTVNTDSWGCRAWCIEKRSANKIVGPSVTIKMAKDEGWYGKKGSKWQTLPELMLRYRAASFLISTTAPELLLGFQTSEEVIDTIDVTATANGTLDQKVTEAQALIVTTPVTTVDMPAPAIKVQSESEKVSAAVAPEPKVAQKRQPSF